MTKAAYLEIMDGYGYWNDCTADLISADVKVGFNDSALWQTNKRMPPPGKLSLRLNNSSKKYTPAQDTPKLSATMVPWRRCRLRMGTPSLGNCLRMTSSGIGGPGSSLNTNTLNAGTANISVNGVSSIERAQAFVTTGGVLSAITFATPNAGISITWSIYADNAGQPGNSLIGGVVTSVSGTNTVITGGNLVFPSGTVLWVSIKAPSTATTNIYTSNGAKTYAAGPIYSNTNSAGWVLDTTNGNYQFSLTLTPQGTIAQQTVNVSGNAGDVLAFSLDHRAQWDSQYNLLGIQILTNAESSPVTVVSSINKYKTQSISFTTTANYTTVTVLVCAAHNTAAINSVYHEIRNGSLTKNGGANLLVNGNFASGALSPWTEASQLDIALFGKEKYDTDVQLRGAAHPGGSVSQTVAPNLTVLGGNGAANQQIVQTFQVTDGQLSQFQVNFGASIGTPLGTVTWEVWLANATSTNSVGYMGFLRLASGTFTPFPSQQNVVNVVNGPLLYASTEYMLVLYATAAQSGTNAWQVQNSSSDVYAGGKLGTAPGNGGAGGSVSNPNGPNWTDTGFDLAFSLTTSATLVKDRLAQNFVVFTPQSVASINLWMAKAGSPTGTLTLRIETDNNGQPSGTLVNANATATLAESSLILTHPPLLPAFGWATFTLPAAVPLSIETPYWLVLSTTRASSGTNYILWGSNATSPTYLASTSGAMLYNASSAWSAETKTAILDLIAASFSSLSVVNDTEIQFNGFVQDIIPDAHQLAGALTTQIACVDFLQLLQTTPFNLPLQVNQKEDALIRALLGLLPSGTLTTTPVGTLLDAGLTTIPYAFDGYVQNKTNPDPGTTHLFAAFGEIVRPVQNRLMLQQALDDVLKSSAGRFWQDADGTLRFANRNQTPALQSIAPAMTIVEGANNTPGSAVKLDAKIDVNSVINHVFVNYHPRQVGTGNVVLAQLNVPPNVDISQFGVPTRRFDKRTNAVIPGKHQITLTFRDAAGKPIAATSIAPPVPDTDFIIQTTQWGTQPAGSVYDILRWALWGSLLTFSYTYTASQAVVTFYNWSSHPLYIAKFQLQGIPLYTYDPLTIEAYDTAIVGPNNLSVNVPLTLDQPFTNDREFSLSLAAYVLNRFKTPRLEGQALTFRNKDSVAGQDVLHTNFFDVVLTPDSQAGLTSSARHFVVGKQWQYTALGGGVIDQMQYVLERCDPALYVKFDDASVGTYDSAGAYYL